MKMEVRINGTVREEWESDPDYDSKELREKVRNVVNQYLCECTEKTHSIIVDILTT